MPPAPSSTIIKSASAKAAPISVPPSISKVANPTLLLDAVIVLFVNVSVVALPTKVSVAFGKVSVLSASGSAATKVVSLASSVEPSNITLVLTVTVENSEAPPPVISVRYATVPEAS